jgi:hypothetical protein
MSDADRLRDLATCLNHARRTAQSLAERWAGSTESRADAQRVSRIVAGGLLLNDALDVLSPLLHEGTESEERA